LTILGNNSAIPAHNRNQTAQVLAIQNHYILIDCGEGTQMQLSRFGIKLGRIRHMLISHLHGDHFYGLMGLLSTMHLYSRKTPLTIFAPPALEEIIALQLRASGTQLSFKLHFKPIAINAIQLLAEESTFTIHAFPLRHGIPCTGFLIREKQKDFRLNKETMPKGMRLEHILKLKRGEPVYDADGKLLYSVEEHTLPPRRSRAYAYCSDTKYDTSLVQHIAGVDLLYHEATFAEDMADRAESTFHSTARQAADIAQKAGVGKLLLGHYSTRYRDPSPLLHEARAVFEESYLSREGESIDIDE
jgi:ribonuclease Z